MKNFKTALKILLIGSTLALVSCKTPQPQSQVQIKTIEKEIEKLVPYALPPDSSTINALFECDSMNQVQLKELSEMKAKGLQSSFSFNNGLLQYKLKQPPDTVYIPSKDRYIYQEIPVEVVKEKIVYRQTTFQTVCCWFGKVFMGLLGLVSAFGLIVLIREWKRLF